ncbi:unnamed protein product [Oppiella nova]|uniref:Uncharacterized protein n=1 Tax=Oppiella nova TaxID=334625 RepID=A0A7R9QAT8_9ACAR|nr:unnamed protein product [Oppiella nova]CAG2162046.1 unnamed protein product [Oppiella nova]
MNGSEEKAVKSERKVMDEWSTKSVYDKPFISVYEMDIKTAEQLMEASNPMDTSALQKLSKYQRKRFYTMRVQNIQNHQNEGPIPPESPPEPAPTRDPTSRYFWSHFRPNLTISFWSEDNSRSVSIKPEIKPEIKLETKPEIKSETNGGRARGGEGLTRDRIYKSLHSVEEYVDYHKLIQKEANMRGENNDSAITRCLRNTELTPEDRNEIQVLCEKPLRKPTTRPFEAKLRPVIVVTDTPVMAKCVKLMVWNREPETVALIKGLMGSVVEIVQTDGNRVVTHQ